MRILSWLRLKLRLVDTGKFSKRARYRVGTKYVDSAGRVWRYFHKVEPF